MRPSILITANIIRYSTHNSNNKPNHPTTTNAPNYCNSHEFTIISTNYDIILLELTVSITIITLLCINHNTMREIVIRASPPNEWFCKTWFLSTFMLSWPRVKDDISRNTKDRAIGQHYPSTQGIKKCQICPLIYFTWENSPNVMIKLSSFCSHSVCAMAQPSQTFNSIGNKHIWWLGKRCVHKLQVFIFTTSA